MSTVIEPVSIEHLTEEESAWQSYRKLVIERTNRAMRDQAEGTRLGRALGKVHGLGLYETYELIKNGVEPDLDEDMVALFLSVYAMTGQVSKAAAAINVWPPAIYMLKRRNKDFANAMAAAKQVAISLAEDELLRRGLEGVEEDIYYQGEVVGSKRVYSDTALLRVLEAERPDKWKKRIANEHTGENGAPIAIDDARSSIANRVAAALGRREASSDSEPEPDGAEGGAT